MPGHTPPAVEGVEGLAQAGAARQVVDRRRRPTESGVGIMGAQLACDAGQSGAEGEHLDRATRQHRGVGEGAAGRGRRAPSSPTRRSGGPGDGRVRPARRWCRADGLALGSRSAWRAVRRRSRRPVTSVGGDSAPGLRRDRAGTQAAEQRPELGGLVGCATGQNDVEVPRCGCSTATVEYLASRPTCHRRARRPRPGSSPADVAVVVVGGDHDLVDTAGAAPASGALHARKNAQRPGRRRGGPPGGRTSVARPAQYTGRAADADLAQGLGSDGELMASPVPPPQRPGEQDGNASGGTASPSASRLEGWPATGHRAVADGAEELTRPGARVPAPDPRGT